MAERDDEVGRPDERAAASIRAELDRVLASDAFRAAPQLSAFLSFVVERTVEGRAAELKGYTIAVEALGRPPDFNPQIDPIVRVEAGRLRRALAQYYACDGQADPIQLSMPVGGYVPVFTFVDGDEEGREETPWAGPAPEPAPSAPPAPAPPADRRAALRWVVASVAALTLGLLALSWWLLMSGGSLMELVAERSVSLPQLSGAQPSAVVAPQLIRVAIANPVLPVDPKQVDLLNRFSGLLVDAMARFDDLVTIKAPPPGTPAGDDVDYVFEMSIQVVDGGAEGLGRLRSVKDGRIVWTTSSGQPSIEILQEAKLAEMARRLATRLTEPFGIINADARQSSPSPAVNCILKGFDARRTMLPGDFAAARSCLRQLIEQDPGFYPAWAHLALLTFGEGGSGQERQAPQGTEASGSPPLDRPLAAAFTAVRLAPASARADQAVMKVLFLRGASEEAVQRGREALARNPYDPEILSDLGSVLIRIGRAEEGLPLVERAIALSVGRPARYDFYAFLGAYLTGAKVSEACAAALAADTTPFGLLGQALIAASEGDHARQAAAARELAEKAPLFGSDPRAYLSRRGFAPEVADKLLIALGIDRRESPPPRGGVP